MNEQETFIKMSDAVLEGDSEALTVIIKKVIGEVDPLILVQKGMMPGLKKIGELFESGEVFLPEMLMAAEAFQEGMKIIEPKLQESGKKVESPGTVVFGTVFSDIHEIGKNIVITLMRTYGFKVIDLGANVSPITFVDESEKANADIIAISSLMTTTMTYQKDVIDYLKERGLRDKYIVLVGGGPVNEEWAEQIGADGTSDSAAGAVRIAEKLITDKKGGVA
ncbi:MAG: corrinoid protein [Spirochaetes bacterium]|nr:corrinoid protein [Spirochaetota bacterium]